MAGFTYRLYLEDGNDIGTFTTAAPNWRAGMEFITGDHVTFRIVSIIPSEEFGSDDFDGVFVVMPVELADV